MKTALALSALVLGLSSAAAMAEDATPSLPPTYIVHKLTGDGIALRALEYENGIYEAKVLATDGSIVTVGVDPGTAELTDAFATKTPRRAKEPPPAIDAAQAIQAAAVTGYWDVREVKFEHGAWRIKAADDSGRLARLAVDGASGTLR